jgi:hypothetical protein
MAMADYLDAEGFLVDVPDPARNLVNHLGAIESWCSFYESHPHLLR